MQEIWKRGFQWDELFIPWLKRVLGGNRKGINVKYPHLVTLPILPIVKQMAGRYGVTRIRGRKHEGVRCRGICQVVNSRSFFFRDGKVESRTIETADLTPVRIDSCIDWNTVILIFGKDTTSYESFLLERQSNCPSLALQCKTAKTLCRQPRRRNQNPHKCWQLEILPHGWQSRRFANQRHHR